MDHPKGKKGVFFTLVSLSLVAIILLLFAKNLSAVRDTESISTRIRSIDAFLVDVESSYLPLSSRAASYKAVQATIAHMNSTRTYLASPEGDLGSVLINGTLGDQVIMASSTLSNFTSHIVMVSEQTYSLDLDISLDGARISQSTPWQIDIEVNFSLHARADVGNWSREGLSLKTSIPIEGFYDPHYLVQSMGLYDQRIVRSNLTLGAWNITVLDGFITQGEYARIEGVASPSFLGRFISSPQGSECCGIESTISPSEVSPTDQQKSYVDHQFWADSEACADLYSIGGGGFSHSGFKLDFSHVTLFNVTAYAQPLACP